MKALAGKLAVAALLCVLALVSAYALHWRSANLSERARLPIAPEADFSAMAIATRAITPATPGAPPIKAWERCALGAARCEQRPRAVEARCQAGVALIAEADWPALRRIPTEDLPGVEHPDSYRTMKLCPP
ncbi:hypothetical protein [Rubrivivax gelatinosus]|uniref:Uncharacterized protein n=1 Tax=Rubrivivax gelatinosus TaxID=28068 RepID=A0A4R2MI43_RUBGE|nr:hypothetical protein [Rubrivivax gelatinosus]MBK1689928.1 hypothetical protein [Rubrivivax gelatinosus]TCO98742.1 hypothetical protein EV684_1162 [Rubrivivax gelatinosus]